MEIQENNCIGIATQLAFFYLYGIYNAPLCSKRGIINTLATLKKVVET